MTLNAQNFKTDLIFPNVVWKTVLSDIDNEELKKFAYSLKSASNGRKLSNVNGWQSDLIQHSNHTEIQKLVEVLEFALTDISVNVGLPMGIISGMWININPINSFNLPHDHQGSYLSGVYYIDAEPAQGNLKFERTDNAEFFIPRESAGTNYTKFEETYSAETNNLYVFGSWMKHSVEQNTLDKDRISLSFNFSLLPDANYNQIETKTSVE